MSFADTVASDFKIIDDVVSATFVSKGPSTNTTIALTYVSGSDLTIQEIAASRGMFGVQDRKWFLPASQIPLANRPKAGDTLTVAGVLWVICDLPAVLDPFGISWEVIAKKGRAT